MISILSYLQIPGAFTALLFTISLALVLAYFLGGRQIGNFEMPQWGLRNRWTLTAGVALFLFMIALSLPVIDQKPDENGPKPVATCDARIFSVGSAMSDLNEVATLDSFTSEAVRGGDFVVRIVIKEHVKLDHLSCASLLLCEPTDPNTCVTKDTAIRPIFGRTNNFTFRVNDTYSPGKYRFQIKFFEVSNPAELGPEPGGVFSLTDPKLYGETRDFLIR